MSTIGLRNAAIASFVIAMVVLLIGGFFAMEKVPPIPDKVVSGGVVLTDRDAIMRGQDVFQKYGLMDHGSVWGHGSLRGPDFSAATLHMTGEIAGETESIEEIRENRYDPETKTLTLTPGQAAALAGARRHWEKTFGEGDPRYGFKPNTVHTAEERQDIADFFFWTAWAAGTNRPDQDYSYTNNWPPDTSVGNRPPVDALVWSVAGILSLFLVLGLVVYIVHRHKFFYGAAHGVEAAHALAAAPVTPSQRASAKFFLVAGLLFVVQIFNGGLLAHYTVHPGEFWVKVIGDTYTYSWAKTWHLQLAVFWIAISWVGTAIYLAPRIAGREPKAQRLLVNLLFGAVFFVVVGSMLGEVLGIKGKLGDLWFWLGHQGWEYLELGRIWQILLFSGLLFWLLIVYRALAPILRGKDTNTPADKRSLVWFYTLSAILVVLFFGFGLVYGRGTHMSVADYWRWFVVHIWVESIFEFFGVAVIALFMVTLGLVTPKSALRAAYLTAIITFLSGIIGTAHHYFWFGGPSFWLALGSVFSSLEPVPLILLVVRGWMEYKSVKDEGREFPYRWPLYFLVASSFWNFVGAAVFGFVINLPIINYYEHATYLTANHAHTAMFGTYGMLAIALILFSWRGLVDGKYWKDGLLKLSFWGLNGGLAVMAFTSLLPVGILQLMSSYRDGFWFARSADFYERSAIVFFGNWRVVPDTVIITLGAMPLLWFLVTTFPKIKKASVETAD